MSVPEISLREHLEGQISSLRDIINRDRLAATELARSHDEAHAREHSFQEKAKDLFAEDLKQWKVVNNEWRQTLSDQAGRFATTEALVALEKSWDERYLRLQDDFNRRVTLLEHAHANMTGRLTMTGIVLGVVVVIVNVALRFI
jgi:hypothetical protein